MENIINNISGKLKGIRAEKGYSLEEIADKIGVHRETFRKYENNPSTIEIGQLLKILDIYDVDTIYFLVFVMAKCQQRIRKKDKSDEKR